MPRSFTLEPALVVFFNTNNSHRPSIQAGCAIYGRRSGGCNQRLSRYGRVRRHCGYGHSLGQHYPRGLEFQVNGYTITGGTLSIPSVGTTVQEDDSVHPYSATIASQIAGSYALTQTGPGTLTLTGSNSYSGGTKITADTAGSGGMVSFANGSLGSSGSITFAANGTLQWNGSNTQDISSRLVIDSGVNATLDVGSNTVMLTSAFGASGSGR